MAIAYAAISLAKITRGNKQPSPGAGRARAGLSSNAVRTALRTHLQRADRASRVNFRAHIQRWRRTSTAMARCLAWMEGGLDAATGPATLDALPRSLPDHELARIALGWVEGRLSCGILGYAAIHTALRPPMTVRHCGIPISRPQG